MRRHTQKALFLNSLIPSPASANVIRVEMEARDDNERFVIEAISTPPGSVTMRLLADDVPLTLWESYCDLDAISDFLIAHRIH